MGRKILAVSLALVMVLSFAACDGGGGEGLPTAQEIIDGAIQALDDVRSYEFEMDMSLDMVAEDEGETLEMSMEMDYSGALDLDNKQLRLEVTASVAMPGEDEEEMGMEAYLVDNIGYMMIEEPGEEPVWDKDEFSEAEWEEAWESTVETLSLAEPQLELLETAEVEVIGSESVKGVDCYVLQITLDAEQLWEMIMQQAMLGFGGSLGLPEFSEELFDKVSHSSSMKQWVAKDTYFLMKVETDMSIELTAEAMGFPEEEGEATIDLAMTILVYNYNQPVSIELPPEAEEATEY